MSEPTVIRDVLLMRLLGCGFFISRQRNGVEHFNPLFIPECDVYRFSVDNTNDIGVDHIQTCYYAAVRATSLRIKSMETFYPCRIEICSGCGQWAGVHREQPAHQCLACSGLLATMPAGEMLRNVPVPMVDHQQHDS